jgi:16S rRNA (cytosine1402-N4)-methyltransferase
MHVENPSTSPRHQPVMPRQVLEFLAPAPGQIIVDATVGTGGHARLIAEKLIPGGRLIGLDRDPAMLEAARANLTDLPVTLVHRNFDELPEVLEKLGIGTVHGILADLGISSAQLDDPARGLSFQQDGPLDMRLDQTTGTPARDLVNRLPERDLADIFYRYGEERFSRRVARRIVAARRIKPLETTGELAALVRKSVPRSRGHAIDPATRVFQGLRIAVNDELGSLERFLENLPRCLAPGGRAVIISFHSLEDRLVKQTFRNKSLFKELTRKPVQADAEEIRANPRARSAKLRAAISV